MEERIQDKEQGTKEHTEGVLKEKEQQEGEPSPTVLGMFSGLRNFIKGGWTRFKEFMSRAFVALGHAGSTVGNALSGLFAPRVISNGGEQESSQGDTFSPGRWMEEQGMKVRKAPNRNVYEIAGKDSLGMTFQKVLSGDELSLCTTPEEMMEKIEAAEDRVYAKTFLKTDGWNFPESVSPSDETILLTSGSGPKKLTVQVPSSILQAMTASEVYHIFDDAVIAQNVEYLDARGISLTVLPEQNGEKHYAASKGDKAYDISESVLKTVSRLELGDLIGKSPLLTDVMQEFEKDGIEAEYIEEEDAYVLKKEGEEDLVLSFTAPYVPHEEIEEKLNKEVLRVYRTVQEEEEEEEEENTGRHAEREESKEETEDFQQDEDGLQSGFQSGLQSGLQSEASAEREVVAQRMTSAERGASDEQENLSERGFSERDAVEQGFSERDAVEQGASAERESSGVPDWYEDNQEEYTEEQILAMKDPELPEPPKWFEDASAQEAEHDREIAERFKKETGREEMTEEDYLNSICSSIPAFSEEEACSDSEVPEKEEQETGSYTGYFDIPDWDFDDEELA